MIYRKEKRITSSRSVALPVIVRRIIQTIRVRAIAVCLHAFAHTHLRAMRRAWVYLWAVSNTHALARVTMGYFIHVLAVYAVLYFSTGVLNDCWELTCLPTHVWLDDLIECWRKSEHEKFSTSFSENLTKGRWMLCATNFEEAFGAMKNKSHALAPLLENLTIIFVIK